MEKRTNCPNCGAPISHYYNYKCDYCGTFLHNTDEKIKKLNNVDIHIEDIDVEYEPIIHKVLITLRGYSIPRVQFYEEGFDNIFVSGEDVGRRVGYRIALEMDDVLKFMANDDPAYLIDKLDKSLPPIFDKHQIVYRTMDKILDWRFHRDGKRF